MIPKSSNPVRITENLKSTELKLDAEDMRRLRDLDRNYRMLSGEFVIKTGDSNCFDELWDVEEDKKFIVAPPQAKKQRRED